VCTLCEVKRRAATASIVTCAGINNYERRLEFKDFSRSVHITREGRSVLGIRYDSA
jgi:hypothetical protein